MRLHLGLVQCPKSKGFGGHQWQNPSIASYCYSLLANLHLGGPVLWRYQLERISGRKLVPCGRRPLSQVIPSTTPLLSFIVLFLVLSSDGPLYTKGQYFWLENFLGVLEYELQGRKRRPRRLSSPEKSWNSWPWAKTAPMSSDPIYC